MYNVRSIFAVFTKGEVGIENAAIVIWFSIFIGSMIIKQTGALILVTDILLVMGLFTELGVSISYYFIVKELKLLEDYPIKRNAKVAIFLESLEEMSLNDKESEYHEVLSVQYLVGDTVIVLPCPKHLFRCIALEEDIIIYTKNDTEIQKNFIVKEEIKCKINKWYRRQKKLTKSSYLFGLFILVVMLLQFVNNI